jgi:hypothetical protein
MPIGFLLIKMKSKKRVVIIGSLFGIFLSVIYPLYVNWRDYHEFNVTTVDSFYAKEFFNGAIMKVLPPFTYVYPYEVNVMFGEYYSEYFPWRTAADRKAMAKKYFNKGWEIIKRDPIDYIKSRFFKMWYVWQKENIFFYSEPGYMQHRLVTYYANITILFTGLVGLIVWRKFRKQSLVGGWVWLTIVGSIIYATIGFSVTHAEYRLTIPFYPLVFIAFSVGLQEFLKRLREVHV